MGQVAAAWAVNALISVAVSAAVSAIISAMQPPIRQRGPRLGDLKAQSTNYGNFIPSIYGTFQNAGTILWIENNKIKEVSNTQTEGGKGGQSVKITTYSYFGTFAILISEGPIEGVQRIWADSVLLYDRTPGTNTNNAYASAALAESITIYTGEEDQSPNPRMEADKGVSPAYRGLAYVVFEDLQLETFGNRIPNILIEPTTSPGDIPFMLEELDPVPFIGPSYVGTTTFDRQFRPTGVANGIIQYDIQGVTLTEVEHDHTVDDPPDITATVYRAVASRSIDGYTVDDTTTEIDLFQKEFFKFHDLAFLSTIRFIASTLNTSGSSGRFYRMAGQKHDFSSVNALLMSIGSGYTTLETINPALQNIFDTRDISESYYYEGNIYFLATAGGGGVSQYVWGITSSGNMFGEQEVPNTANPSRVAMKVFANENGVYVLTSLGAGSSLDIARYDLDLDELTGHWEDLTAQQGGHGLVSIPSAAIFVEGQDLCIFGTDGSSMIATAWTLSEFSLSGGGGLGFGGGTFQFPIALGRLVLPLESWLATQPASLGGGLFNVGNATVVCSTLFNGAPPKLSDVVTAMATRAGIAEADIDVTSLEGDTVEGFAVTSLQTMASNIRPLQMAYPFDVVESDWKLKFVRRGNAVPIPLTEDDLAAHELSSQQPNALLLERQKEIELPRQVNVKFQNTTRNYDIGEQHQSRQTTESDNVWQVELPLAGDDEQAIRWADVLLYASWLERNMFEFQIGIKHLALEPTDTITIDIDDTLHAVRLAEIDFGRPGLMQCKGVAFDSSHYSSNAVTEPALPQQEIPIVWAMATKLDFLDIPLMRETDDSINPGVYVAAYPAAPSWKEQWGGVSIFSTNQTSTGNDGSLVPINFEEDGFTSKQAIYGGVNSYSNLPIKATVIDKANALNVTVRSEDQLFSVNDDDFLAGKNALVVFHTGDEIAAGTDAFRYEILFFKNAVLEVDGTYTLSHFVRGLFGSPKLGTVLPADLNLTIMKWWLLDPDRITRINRDSTDIYVGSNSPSGASRYYKGVTNGAFSIKTRDQIEGFSGRSSKPLAPVHVRGYRNAAGDITIRWMRTTRYNGEWADGGDVPLNEGDLDEYALQILHSTGDGFRTIEGIVGPEYVYTAAEQIVDFGSVQAAQLIEVHQLSNHTYISNPLLAGGRAGEGARVTV